METSQLESLVVLRIAVGYLGEQNQYNWWPSSFFSSASNAFLVPIFPRNTNLARYTGVTYAAALVHDERIGIGRVYHLFRLPHQVQNFVRFCEAVVKQVTVKRIQLITGCDDTIQLAEVQEKLDDFQQSLLELEVVLEVEINPNLHDREIRIDNGWVIKIGRGLDFYQKPDSWHAIGANDLSLCKCLETKVDIFWSETSAVPS